MLLAQLKSHDADASMLRRCSAAGAGALWALNVISKVDPKVGARVLKAGGGLLALGLAVFLGLRGEIGIAIPLGAFGLGLLGWLPFGPAGFSARTQKSSGQTSRVRSAYFEMELDHDSGDDARAHRRRPPSGRARSSASTSRRWSNCWPRSTRKAARYWWRILTAGIPAGVNTRRVTRQRGGARRPAAKCRNRRPIRSLAWKPGASADDISRAHRTLMKKFHPDQGGSTYLAARINEAKEILLRRHR